METDPRVPHRDARRVGSLASRVDNGKVSSRGETFFDVVAEEFAWLVTDVGMVGPELTEVVIPCARYHGPLIEYEICLDTGDASVETRVRLRDQSPATGWVALEHVVRTAGYPQRERIRTSAQTRHALRQSVISQSDWLRRLHPRLVDDGGPG